MILHLEYGRYALLILIALPIIWICCLVFFCGAIGAIKENRRLSEYFYGSKKPAGSAPLLHSFTEDNVEYIAYVQEKKAVYTYSYDKYCAERGKQPVKAINWISSNRIWLAIAVAIMVVVILICSMVPSVLGNNFGAGLMRKIELGDTRSVVTYYLGEPDIEMSSYYIYIDSKYERIIEEYQNLEDQAATATSTWREWILESKIAALESRLFSIIVVEFSDNVVTAVWLNKGATLEDIDSYYYGNNAKTLAKVAVLSGSTRSLTIASITYEAKFTDGSYVKASAAASISTATNTIGSSVKVTWSDKWCELYSAHMTLATSI